MHRDETPAYCEFRSMQRQYRMHANSLFNTLILSLLRLLYCIFCCTKSNSLSVKCPCINTNHVHVNSSTSTHCTRTKVRSNGERSARHFDEKSFPFHLARANENLTAEQFCESRHCRRSRPTEQKTKTLFSAFGWFIRIRKPAVKRIASIPRGLRRQRERSLAVLAAVLAYSDGIE